ncbi:MAG TPA: outer membrane beta-barrel protein [Bacteroidales bacterium]|jgi:hypothetical protein|nr:MAG: hypothetical protein BWY27_01294 [Bacteroidetes bacterium ADurb.Bin234]HOS16688.1 outer membrane beta-barrel protein [Bacteroidales bacterium]
MRKISSIIIIICIISIHTIFGQDLRPRTVEVGVIAGPTLCWASPKNVGYDNEGAKIGGMYGLNVDINLAKPLKNYFFHTGINARHIRTELSFNDEYKPYDTATIEAKYNMVYLSIPTAIKFKTDEFGRFVIFGTFGMDNSFCVSSKLKYKEINNVKEDKTENIYKQTFFVREALLVCLGFEFLIKNNTKASFALAFNNSFTPTYRKDYTNKNNGERVDDKSRMFEFQFGFIF